MLGNQILEEFRPAICPQFLPFVNDVACMFRHHFYILIALMLAAPTVSVHAQDAGGKKEPSSVSSDEQLEKLLTDLGSSTFSVRQKAALRVLELSASDVRSLESQMGSAPASVSTQLKVLIPRLRRRLFDEQLEKLSKDDTSEAEAAEIVALLPEWNRYSAMTGNDPDSVVVYRELLVAERDLFSARLFAADDFATRLETRSAAVSALCDGQADEAFPVASFAALMLLGSNPDLHLQGTTSANISSALDDPRFGKLIEKGVHSKTLKAITESWIERPEIAVDRPLLFAMQHRLPAGRRVALTTLDRSTRNQRTYYALLCLATFQQTEDLPLVESLLSNEKTLWPPRGQLVRELLPDREIDSTFSVQTRDVALAVAIHLRGEKPQEFGIDVVPSDAHLFTIESMGFSNDEQREAALAKYRARFAAASPSR